MLLQSAVKMQMSTEERRSMRRFDMRLPATVRMGENAGEFHTETQNVSARGVFLPPCPIHERHAPGRAAERVSVCKT